LSEADFQINECQVVALEKGLQWPMEALVPALDIFRISLLHPKFNEIFCSLQVNKLIWFKRKSKL